MSRFDVPTRALSERLKKERKKLHWDRDFSMCAFSPCWRCAGGPCVEKTDAAKTDATKATGPEPVAIAPAATPVLCQAVGASRVDRATSNWSETEPD